MIYSIQKNIDKLLCQDIDDYEVVAWSTDIIILEGEKSPFPLRLKNIHGGFKYSKELLSECENMDILYCLYEPWHKMIKRSHIKKNNLKFSESISANDLFFSIMLASCSSNVGISSVPMYCYIKRGDSLSENT